MDKMKTKCLADKQIQEQIIALEEENANTMRLSFRRGHGWGDGVLEKRRDKIDHLQSILAMRKFDKRKTPKKQLSAKSLTDKQIERKIAELEEENRNTQRLSMGRGHGWGDDAMERRRDKINRLESIQLMRRLDKRKATPKKEGLSRTWDSKAKRWVYVYTKRAKKKAKSLKGKSIPKPLEELLKEAKKHKTATEFKKWWQTQAEDPFSHWRSARMSKALSDAKLVKGGFPDYKTIFELAKKQPDTKLSQHDKLLLAGEYKIRGKPKDVRKLGKPVTKGLKKTKKVTEKPKIKPKPKKKKKTKAKSHQKALFGGL